VIQLAGLQPGEIAVACEWLSDPDINRWLKSVFRGRRIDRSTVAVMLRDKRNHVLMIRDDAGPCGLVGISEIDRLDRVGMIWYLLGEKSRGGKGVTSLAVGLALDRAFGDLDLACVYAWIIDGNEPSRRVLEKNGFQPIGRMRGATRLGEEIVDRVYFDVTRDDHLSRREAEARWGR